MEGNGGGIKGWRCSFRKEGREREKKKAGGGRGRYSRQEEQAIEGRYGREWRWDKGMEMQL